MIPVYLLCLTILFTSVIKVTDVFITLDKNLTEKRLEFIKKTRSIHHQNEDGSITLIAILFTLMISALLMFFALKDNLELKEARYRKDSYLCFQFLNIETENYILDMSKFNIALRTLYAGQFIAQTAAAAKAAHQATKVARNARHFHYVKNLFKNKYCKGPTDSMSYLKNFPYKTNLALVLETNIDATTKLKAPAWTVTEYKNPIGIRFKNSFCLVAEIQVAGEIVTNFKIQTSEISMAGFSKLKCSSGYQ